jgi:hypothetical protein
MKAIAIIMLFPFFVQAQFDLRATLSQTILNMSFGKAGTPSYFYGGSGFGSPTIGLEGEWRFRRSRINNDSTDVLNPRAHTSSSVEVVVLYANYKREVLGKTADNDPLTSSFNVRLLQIPIIYKVSAHLSALDENVRISFGIGVVASYVMYSHLKESAQDFSYANNKLVGERDYSDEANTTSDGPRFYLSPVCFEFSFAFKRLFIAERAWFSFQNMYMNNLSGHWSVPDSHSIYLNAYQTWPKVTYGGGTFSIGLKINKPRN